MSVTKQCIKSVCIFTIKATKKFEIIIYSALYLKHDQNYISGGGGEELHRICTINLHFYLDFPTPIFNPLPLVLTRSLCMHACTAFSKELLACLLNGNIMLLTGSNVNQA